VSDERVPIPTIVTSAGGGSLVACPCGKLNAVRLAIAYQCRCGWAVLVTHSVDRLVTDFVFRD
jgi:hypothetical protein